MSGNRDRFIAVFIKWTAVLCNRFGQILRFLRFLNWLVGKLSHHLLRLLEVTFAVNGETVDIFTDEVKHIATLLCNTMEKPLLSFIVRVFDDNIIHLVPPAINVYHLHKFTDTGMTVDKIAEG